MEDLGDVSKEIAKLRIMGGDFNVILNDSKKLGGLLVTQHEIMDFTQCINMYALSEIKFTESSYTW